MANPATYDSDTRSFPNSNPTMTSDEIIKPLGFIQMASLSATTAASFSSIPVGATLAVIIAEGEPIRFRDDGTAPTASVGMPLAPNEPFTYKGALSAIQFIGQVAGATLNVSFYK